MPKAAANPFARRKSSASPFATLPRTKSGVRKSSQSVKEDTKDRIEDSGLTPSLAPVGVKQDVLSLMRYTQEQMWDDIPERGAGMGSERISEVLRFRKALPPIVSTANLHAMSTSSTATERELAKMVATGKVRKITIPGRGKGGSIVGEGVVDVEAWKLRLGEESGLQGLLNEKYHALLDSFPTAATVSVASLEEDEVLQLVRLGFLTSPAGLTSGAKHTPKDQAPPALSRAGSSFATGTLAAVGGLGAMHESGSGGGSSFAVQSAPRRRPAHLQEHYMTLSLPSTGAYLKLLTEARLHLVFLLKQLSPRFKEATRDLLKEKWDGNVIGTDGDEMKKARGEWNGVLPGKTKKWREFYGLRFEWVLAECVGSGAVEVFETGSVGWGVRAR